MSTTLHAKQSRRQLLGVLGIGVLLGLAGCFAPGNEHKHSRPNVLFILVDDLGYHDLSCTGSNFYETPHIDSLFAESYIFAQGYANSRVCSPSRASILLGQSTLRHGITDWIGALSGEDWRQRNRHDRMLPADYVRQLPVASTTLAEAFRDAGYTTFFAGKWHLGGTGSLPEDHGFDINRGGWDKGSPKGGYYAPWTNPSLPQGSAGENLTQRLAEETGAFMLTQPDSPFFAMLSFYAVHAPLQTTRPLWQKYQAKATAQGLAEQGFAMEQVLPTRRVQDDPVYAGLVETMDAAVGHVLQVLAESGLRENTIVVFTSDHGGVASGDHYATSNLPLRGGKGYPWEGGLRVPYCISLPGQGPVASPITTPVVGADLYPTLLDLCGLEVDELQHAVDGRSLRPLLSGDTLPERALYWHYPHYGNQGGEPSSVIRQGPWKLIHYYEDGRDELYHLPSDPGERRDVALQHPSVSLALAQDLSAALATSGALRPRPDSLYDAVAAQHRRTKHEAVLLPRLEQERRERLALGYAPNATWWGSE